MSFSRHFLKQEHTNCVPTNCTKHYVFTCINNFLYNASSSTESPFSPSSLATFNKLVSAVEAAILDCALMWSAIKSIKVTNYFSLPLPPCGLELMVFHCTGTVLKRLFQSFILNPLQAINHHPSACGVFKGCLDFMITLGIIFCFGCRPITVFFCTVGSNRRKRKRIPGKGSKNNVIKEELKCDLRS